MNNINEIYRLHTHWRDEFAYVGTLRNEKTFNLNDKVFIAYQGHDIAKGTIVGVELPPVQNADYIYKIQIPEEWVEQYWKRNAYDGTLSSYDADRLYKVELICDHIFSTIDEAKDSAIKELEKRSELQRSVVERYFKQFED